jgi:hypothetical protein
MEVMCIGTADRDVNRQLKLHSVTYSHLIAAVIGKFNLMAPKIVVRHNCSDISN